MAVLQCARGCTRLISVSDIPGGNPTALADPEGFALQYLRCSGCGACVCDRCAALPPRLSGPCPCPGCGAQMGWAGVAPASLPKTQAMDAASLPPMGMAPSHGGGASQAHSPPQRAYGASYGRPEPAAAPPMAWWTLWRASGGARYARSAPVSVIQAEIPRIVAFYRQRKKLGAVFGWGALAAFLGALPAAWFSYEFISRAIQEETLSIVGASFVLMLALWWVVGPAEMDLNRFTDLQKLLAKLRLDPTKDTRVLLLGPHEGRWIEVEGTLTSGIRVLVARIQKKTFVSQTRSGNTIRTTYSITADDDITLSFEAGRVREGQVEAAATLLRNKLAGPSGGRLHVLGNATTFNLRFPAMVRPSIEEASTSMPKLVAMLHSMVAGQASAVDDNGQPPALDAPAEPANGGLPGMMMQPLSIGVAALVLVVGTVGLVIGVGSSLYERYAHDRISAIYEAERASGYGGYGSYGYGSPPRDPALDAERRELRDRADLADMGSMACVGPSFCFTAFGPLMLAMAGYGFFRRQQKRS